MSATKILIVEDDRNLAEVLTYNLKQQGYEVQVANDGRQALNMAVVSVPDIVILDLMLPVVDGLEVCRRLRADSITAGTLILMLTAKSEETDQVVGFSLGADDYVTKPFSVKVLIERIKALERRRRLSDMQSHDIVTCHDVTIDRSRHQAYIGQQPLQLTRSEFRLLEMLIRRPGRVFSRIELINGALGEDAIVLDRTIDVHIRGLRGKMEDYAGLVETVRGVGYRFRSPTDDGPRSAEPEDDTSEA